MTGGTILVVDDEPVITVALRRALGGRHHVIAVNDPFEALEIVEREPIDLVITDKDMPQMSGHMLLDLLREGHPDIPCVMLTGTPNLQSAMVALNTEQVIRYLAKPWGVRELEETVAAGLARRAKLVETAAARAAEEAKASLVAQLAAQEPGVAEAAAAPLALAATPLSESLAEALRRLQLATATPPPADLADLVRAAPPGELARALAVLPVRHLGVGVLIRPAGDGATIDVDLRGQVYPVASVSREQADLVAARLAIQAALDPGAPAERIGRFRAALADSDVQLLVAYRHSTAGATLEMRRIVLGADAAVPSAVPGQIDRYKLLAPVGSGGMGAVYRAVHRDIGREVAIKVLRGAYAQDPISNARFLREARAAVKARHPRIVETIDFGQLADGRPYLVMELVEAETLRQRIARGPLPPAEAIRVARGIAEALAAAHAVEIVHRDLKPANVFVDEELQVKLADFGAAKVLDDPEQALTGAGITLGTPYYMAPEQITGGAVDGRSDLYALGCVLHEMLDGHPPFRGTSTRAVLAQHLHTDPPTPCSPHEPLSPALLHVLRTALAKQPRRRYHTAAALITDLDIAAERQQRQ